MFGLRLRSGVKPAIGLKTPRLTVGLLPRGLLNDFGISPGAKARGLQWLEGAGLIRVSRGRAARVELITVPHP